MDPVPDLVNDPCLNEAADQNKEAADRDDDVVAESGDRIFNGKNLRKHKSDHQNKPDDIHRQLFAREQDYRKNEQDQCDHDRGHCPIRIRVLWRM